MFDRIIIGNCLSERLSPVGLWSAPGLVALEGLCSGILFAVQVKYISEVENDTSVWQEMDYIYFITAVLSLYVQLTN